MTADLTSELQKELSRRILVLDGAMGTTIREYQLTEAQARGERFAKNIKDLLNNGDILSITRPDVIGDIHKRFLEAGSDIIETNTFSGTTLAQSEFFVEDPRETARAARTPSSSPARSATIPSSRTSPGRSTTSPPSSPASGATASATRPAASATSPARSGP